MLMGGIQVQFDSLWLMF